MLPLKSSLSQKQEHCYHKRQPMQSSTGPLCPRTSVCFNYTNSRVAAVRPERALCCALGHQQPVYQHLSTCVEPHDAVCHVLSAKQCRDLHQISTAITLSLAWTFACHLSLRGGRHCHPRAACHGGQESRTVTKLECQLADRRTQKVLKSSVLRESKQMPELF